jgi:hypothetical protein
MEVDMNEKYTYYNGDLYHHGVKGQKWGVRRWQNEDGSLTSAGKARFKKVSESERLQKRDKKDAKKIVKKNLFIYKPEEQAEWYNRQAEKLRAKGNTEKANKYVQIAKNFTHTGKVLNKKLSDIDSDKLKAGRDYVVHRGLSIDWAGLKYNSTMVEKPTKK